MLHYVTFRSRWSQIRWVYFLLFGWARANKATSLCFHLYPTIGASHSATGSRCMYDPLITCPLDDIGLSAVGLGSTNLGRSRSYWSDAPRQTSTHSKAPLYLRAETPVAYHTDVDPRPSLESNSSVNSYWTSVPRYLFMAYLTFVYFELFSPKRPDGVWSPASLQCNAHRGLLRRWYSGRSVKLTTHYHLVPRLWSGAVSASPLVPPRLVQGQFEPRFYVRLYSVTILSDSRWLPFPVQSFIGLPWPTHSKLQMPVGTWQKDGWLSHKIKQLLHSATKAGHSGDGQIFSGNKKCHLSTLYFEQRPDLNYCVNSKRIEPQNC